MKTTVMTKTFEKSTIVSLIEMFNVCPFRSGETSSEIESDTVKAGIQNGYIFHPMCDDYYLASFLSARDMQYNSTFYKTWNDVKNSSRLEIFIDQILHYCSTYGTNFEDDAWIPNVEPNEPEWNTYKIITPITYEDLYLKCLGMLQSGVALKSDTVKVLTDYIITFVSWKNQTVDVDSIKNREALVILCDKLNVLPKNGNKLFSHIIYKTTGETMIIKNRDMRKRIINSMRHSTKDNIESIRSIWKSLKEDQLIALAGVYNRYKELFLSFKSKNDATMNKIINKIGHLSKKHHKPMTRGFWETILSNKTYNPVEVAEMAKTATNFKLIQVMQSIRERILLATGLGDNLYIVRNGKIFMKENKYSESDSIYSKWEEIYQICQDQLVENLSKKACKVQFSDKFDLACPTSEKNFIGDVPMGSSCKIEKDCVFGIYWKNEWGTQDFDLSYNDISGNRIGWNSFYYSELQDIIYSGDITNAPEGANELMYIQRSCPNGIIYVNRYNGDPNSKFKLFFGKNHDKKWSNKFDLTGDYYMVNPNDVILETMVTQTDSSEMMCGVIIDSTVYFITLSCGYNRVAAATRKLNSKNEVDTKGITDMLMRKAHSCIDLKTILLKAGFTETENDEIPDMNFNVLDRSTLIELFS